MFDSVHVSGPRLHDRLAKFLVPETLGSELGSYAMGLKPGLQKFYAACD